MSTQPPRRRRRPDVRPSTSGGDGGGWLPTIAMGLGVVVAGLGIGALAAILMQRNAAKAPPVVVVTSTPAPSQAPRQPPVAIATLEPPRTPRPAPSATPLPTVRPTRSPASAAPSPAQPSAAEVGSAATAAGAAEPTPTPTAARVAAAPSATAASAASPVRTSAPSATALATAPPPASALVTPPASSPQPPSSYDEHASGVVRRYLDALIRGDEKTAYGALGGSGGTLSEEAFLDPGARVVSVKVTRIDASNATVGCEIVSAKGHYYATYHVTAATSGPYISEHDYIKV